VALVRTVLKTPPILILDEATVALRRRGFIQNAPFSILRGP